MSKALDFIKALSALRRAANAITEGGLREITVSKTLEHTISSELSAISSVPMPLDLKSIKLYGIEVTLAPQQKDRE